MAAGSAEDLLNGAPPPLPREIRGELRGVMNQYVAHLVGNPLRLKPYLGEVFSHSQG